MALSGHPGLPVAASRESGLSSDRLPQPQRAGRRLVWYSAPNRDRQGADRSLSRFATVASNLIVQHEALARLLWKDPHVRRLEHNQGIRRNAGRDEDTGADGAAFSDDRVAAHDRGAGIDGD